jgi:hypothetical protein
MAKGIMYSLDKVLARLLETNEGLNKRLEQLEELFVGRSVPGKRGRKPGRKPGRRGRKASFKKCSVWGCKKEHYAKGLCASHYQQKRLKVIKKIKK